ncbi:UNVERIFIED_CONTAM: hypothetical protein FKN15_017726 [Acipenser sinensis]
MKCYNCGERGHFSFECKNLKSCRVCGDAGHLQRDCPKRLYATVAAAPEGRPTSEVTTERGRERKQDRKEEPQKAGTSEEEVLPGSLTDVEILEGAQCGEVRPGEGEGELPGPSTMAVLPEVSQESVIAISQELGSLPCPLSPLKEGRNVEDSGREPTEEGMDTDGYKVTKRKASSGQRNAKRAPINYIIGGGFHALLGKKDSGEQREEEEEEGNVIPDTQPGAAEKGFLCPTSVTDFATTTHMVKVGREGNSSGGPEST